jgi:hypothetical protein
MLSDLRLIVNCLFCRFYKVLSLLYFFLLIYLLVGIKRQSINNQILFRWFFKFLSFNFVNNILLISFFGDRIVLILLIFRDLFRGIIILILIIFPYEIRILYRYLRLRRFQKLSNILYGTFWRFAIFFLNFETFNWTIFNNLRLR